MAGCSIDRGRDFPRATVTNPLRAVIRGFDGWLSHVEGVECFSDDPQVIMRLQLARADHEIKLPEESIPEGAKVLLVHILNEKIPQIPSDGADLAYGLRLHRLLVSSWRALANHIKSRPEMEDIQALGAI